MEKENKSQLIANELKSIHCIICNSTLVLKYLNQSQQILLCSNKKVTNKV